MSANNTDNAFSDMLNQYVHNDLMYAEYIKRDFLLNKVEKIQNWYGGALIVPFEGAHASSFSFGNLTASADISAYNYQRGSISSQVELWGEKVRPLAA